MSEVWNGCHQKPCRSARMCTRMRDCESQFRNKLEEPSMTDHPEWVWKRAAEVLNGVSEKREWLPSRKTVPMQAVASLIAKHEQPPADPDEEVVRVVIGAWLGGEVINPTKPTADALAAYKALMASRNATD